MMNEDPSSATGRRIRELCRFGAITGPTAGLAMGYVQANVVVLPESYARDFAEFCRKNPQPCPVLEVTQPGSWEPKKCAPEADLRTDLPKYRVFHDGQCIESPTTLLKYWNDERDSADRRWTGFLIGCSFTFEEALLRASLPVRHIEEGVNVPMYRTNVVCTPVGEFRTNMVVSMRPMTPGDALRARDITRTMPHVHGEPIHIGDPTTIGIRDLNTPDYGDRVTINPGEIPVFWACGVTPMEAILNAKPNLAITHEPGHMLVTDVRVEDLLRSAPTSAL